MGAFSIKSRLKCHAHSALQHDTVRLGDCANEIGVPLGLDEDVVGLYGHYASRKAHRGLGICGITGSELYLDLFVIGEALSDGFFKNFGRLSCFPLHEQQPSKQANIRRIRYTIEFALYKYRHALRVRLAQVEHCSNIGHERSELIKPRLDDRLKDLDGFLGRALLTIGAPEEVYGTTNQGGYDYYDGVVFQLAPRANGTWTETVLYTFCSASSYTDGRARGERHVDRDRAAQLQK